jgi:hypothetical protein
LWQFAAVRVSIMRRVFVMAFAGASLVGCSSFSLDSFKPTPPTVQVQLDSVPSGADAKTSLGPGCITPCSVAVPAVDSGFSVTYTMAKFLPETIQVQVVNIPGDFSTPASTTIDPNPVVAELKPAGPPPKPIRRPRPKPKKPKPPAAAAVAPAASPFPSPAAAAAPAASPFPNPAAAAAPAASPFPNPPPATAPAR